MIGLAFLSREIHFVSGPRFSYGDLRRKAKDETT